MSKLILSALLLAALGTAPQASRAADDDDVRLDDGPKLRLYGFADFNYRLPMVANDSKWAAANPHGMAAVGNLNLYLDGQLSDRVRSLIEVRFTYAPNGTLQVPDGKGGVLKTTTNTTDYGGAYSSSFTWGGVDIERAWIEYKFSDLITTRVGEFLTPYGVWNVDHGSPTLVGVKPPYIIAQEWFPRHQVGAEVYGSRYLGSSTRAGWHFTVSNGRIANNPEYTNTNGRAAVGARLFLEGDQLGEWRVGASGFSGRYTEPKTDTPAGGTAVTTIANEYNERVLGADVSWKLSKFRLVSEFIYGKVDYTDSSKTDYNRRGWYGLVTYDAPWGLTPWTQLDISRANTDVASDLFAAKLGLNKRVLPGVIVKLVLNRVWYEGSAATNTDKYNEFLTQVAWAF